LSVLLFTHKSMLGEKLKDIGRQMLGQGAEVKFKKAAENYERTHVVSATEARRAVFNDLMDSLQQEMRLTGGIDPNSDFWKEFRGGMNELFGKVKIDEFKNEANRHTFALPPLGAREYDAAAKYYKKRFENNLPNMGRVKALAENNAYIRGLLARTMSDPRYAGSRDLKTLMADPANADLRASIGKVLMAREAIKDDYRRFGKEIEFKKSMDNLKNTAKESLYRMFIGSPAKLMGDQLKAGMKGDVSGFFKAMEPFAKEQVKAAGKLAWAGAKTAASKVNKMMD